MVLLPGDPTSHEAASNQQSANAQREQRRCATTTGLRKLFGSRCRGRCRGWRRRRRGSLRSRRGSGSRSRSGSRGRNGRGRRGGSGSRHGLRRLLNDPTLAANVELLSDLTGLATLIGRLINLRYGVGGNERQCQS
ncbi:MAG TPA: hypothetical protein VHF70_04160 [Rubrobacteraceae bacterium]|nr:hypothetical protein [Rubrobacteraceae bacterium]